jgi:hypothetical protein
MVWVVPVVAIIAFAALPGCGGSSDDTTATNTFTSSAPRGAAASHHRRSGAASNRGSAGGGPAQPTAGGKRAKGPRAPSPATCVIDWNHGGATPQLLHVLGPTVRAAGPFRAEIGALGASCAVVVRATGVEGGGGVTYKMRERSPGGGFVQGAVPPLQPAAAAVLERNGLLRLR